ncbi:MAG: gluconokinase [Pseudomonadota bacterium]
MQREFSNDGTTIDQLSHLSQKVAIRWVIMGVSGCGKSEIGSRLAARMGVCYAEGDDDHPSDNVIKMAAGFPLDDADRQQWLLILQQRLHVAVAAGEGLVVSCSALKRRYRDVLRAADPALVFIHLGGSRELIAERLNARSHRFMPSTLLDSQFGTLEPLESDEIGMLLDISLTPNQIIEEISERWIPA